LIWHIKKHVSKLRAHQKLKWLEAWQGDIIARGQYMWESFYRAFTGQTVRNMLGRMSPKKPTGSSLVDFQLERSRSIICRRILQCEITKTCLLMWNYKNTGPQKGYLTFTIRIAPQQLIFFSIYFTILLW
jgi:hypothetical protein